jgi:hypothetical protein
MSGRTQPMTETPSPLPWEVVAGTDHHGAYIVSAAGLDVCDLYAMSNPMAASLRNGRDSRPVAFRDMDANARLIIEAVNSHEALKARIQELEGALQKEIANLEERHPKRFLEISLSYEALLWQRLTALQPKSAK